MEGYRVVQVQGVVRVGGLKGWGSRGVGVGV